MPRAAVVPAKVTPLDKATLDRETLDLETLGRATSDRAAFDEATFDDGFVAFIEGDYEQAEAIWRPLALGGDIEAQRSIGIMYRDGIGWNRTRRWRRRGSRGQRPRATRSRRFF